MKGLFGARNEEEIRKSPDGNVSVAAEHQQKRRERPPAGKDNLNAFLGEGTSFKGELTFEGTVRVDGSLEGEIFTKDTLVIGKSAKVQADIHAGSLIISGTMHGNITAENKVELHSSARLYGNISTPSLTIAEGVVFEGNCSMGKKTEKPVIKSRENKPAPAPAPQQKAVNI